MVLLMNMPYIQLVLVDSKHCTLAGKLAVTLWLMQDAVDEQGMHLEGTHMHHSMRELTKMSG